MLPPNKRMRSSQEFQRVYRVGSSWAHPLAVLRVLPAPGVEQRIGITVSKKVGKAVRRNLVRRRLREIVRALLPQAKTGFVAVIVARPAAADAEFAELQAAIQSLFRRARVLREPQEPLDTLYIMPERNPARPAARKRPGPREEVVRDRALRDEPLRNEAQ